MTWWNNYVGIPYKEKGRDYNGTDCWGLVRLIYKEQFNTELPSFIESYSTGDTKEIQEIINRNKEYWKLVDIPRTGDVVLLKIEGMESHVGIHTLPGFFIHTRDKSNTTIERLDSPMWKKRVIGTYRYAEKSSESIDLVAVPNPLKTIKVNLTLVPGYTLYQIAKEVQIKSEIPEELIGNVSIFVNDKNIDIKEWATYIPEAGDRIEYRSVPTGSGIGKIIGMIAIAVFAWYAAPLLLTGGAWGGMASLSSVAGTGAFGLSAAATGSLIATGINMVGGLLLNAIFPTRPPTQDSQGNATEQGRSMSLISGSSNSSNPYGSIPLVLGYVKYNPPVGAQSWTDDKKRTSNLHLMLAWGYGPLAITNVKIDNVPISRFAGVTQSYVDYLQTNDTTGELEENPNEVPDSVFTSIYNKEVKQNNLDIKLKNITWWNSANNMNATPPFYMSIDTDTTTTIGSTVYTARHVYTSTDHLINDGDNVLLYNNFSYTNEDADHLATESLGSGIAIVDSSTSFHILSKNAFPTLYSPNRLLRRIHAYNTVTTYIDDYVNRIVIDINFPQGLVETQAEGKDTGKLWARPVTFQVQLRKIDPLNSANDGNWYTYYGEKVHTYGYPTALSLGRNDIHTLPSWMGSIDYLFPEANIYTYTVVGLDSRLNLIKVHTTNSSSSNPLITTFYENGVSSGWIGEPDGNGYIGNNNVVTYAEALARVTYPLYGLKYKVESVDNYEKLIYNYKSSYTTNTYVGTYSITGTTCTVTPPSNFNPDRGEWVYLQFTSGTGITDYYIVESDGISTFVVTHSSRTTSGNVNIISGNFLIIDGLNIDVTRTSVSAGKVQVLSSSSGSSVFSIGGENQKFCKEKNAFNHCIYINTDPTYHYEVRVGRSGGSDHDWDPGALRHNQSTSILLSVKGFTSSAPIITTNLRDADNNKVKLVRSAYEIPATDQLNGNISGLSGEVRSFCLDCTESNLNVISRSASGLVTITSSVPHLFRTGNTVIVENTGSALDGTYIGVTKVTSYIVTGTATASLIAPVLNTGTVRDIRGSWIKRVTSNPSSLYRYVLQHQGNAKKQPDSKIDLIKLKEFHQFCRQKGFQYNNVIQSATSLDTILKDVCAAGRSSSTFIDGKWSVIIEQPRTQVVQHFTPHNSWDFESTKALPKIPHALRVEFPNSQKNFKPDEIIVYDTGYIEANKVVTKTGVVALSDILITLTGSKTINGVVVITGDRVLVAGQSNSGIYYGHIDNGIYIVNSAGAWARATDNDEAHEFNDIIVGVGSGDTEYGNTYFSQIHTVVTLGTDIIEFNPYKGIATLYETISLPGVTLSTQAYRLTKFHLAQLRLRPETYTLNTDIEYLVCTRGDLVRVTHDVPMWGNGSARLKRVYWNSSSGKTEVYLDEFINLESGKTYKLRTRGNSATSGALDSNIYTLDSVGSTAYYDIVYITGNQTNSTTLIPGNLIVIGETSLEYADCIVLSIEPLTNMSAKLTLVDYSPAIYTVADNDNLPIPAFNSKITEDPPHLAHYLKHEPNIISFVSDETVMGLIAPGIYTYALKIIISAKAYYPGTPNLYTLSNPPQFIEAEIDLLGDNKIVWSDRQVIDTKQHYITFNNIIEGATYQIRCRYISSDGKVGNWAKVNRYVGVNSSTDINYPTTYFNTYFDGTMYNSTAYTTSINIPYLRHTIAGRKAPPKVVTGLTVIPSSTRLKLNWRDNLEIDIANYEVRTNDAFFGYSNLVDASFSYSIYNNVCTINKAKSLTDGMVANITFTSGVATDGDYTIYTTTANDITKYKFNTVGTANTEGSCIINTTGRIMYGSISECLTIPTLGTNTYYIRAIDSANNWSTASASVTYTYSVPVAPSTFTTTYHDTSTTSATLTLDWNDVSTPFGVKDYKVSKNGTTLAHIGASTYTVPVNWGTAPYGAPAGATFVVQTRDTNLIYSAGTTNVVTFTGPGQVPTMSVTDVTTNGIMKKFTYVVSSNVCYVTCSGHGFTTESIVRLDFTTGTAPDNNYTIISSNLTINKFKVNVTTANTSGEGFLYSLSTTKTAFLDWDSAVKGSLSIVGYEIRTSNSSWGTSGYVYRGAASKATIGGLSIAKPTTLYIRAFDTDGKYSNTVTSKVIDVSSPIGITKVTISRNLNNFDIIIISSKPYDFSHFEVQMGKVNSGIPSTGPFWNNSSVLYTTKTPLNSISVPISAFKNGLAGKTTYRVAVKIIDESGNESASEKNASFVLT